MNVTERWTYILVSILAALVFAALINESAVREIHYQRVCLEIDARSNMTDYLLNRKGF